MKCIKNTTTGNIRRVDDNAARTYVKSNNWVYVPKSEWKATGRKR